MGLHFLSSDAVVVGVVVVVVIALSHPAWKAPGHLPSSWFYK